MCAIVMCTDVVSCEFDGGVELHQGLDWKPRPKGERVGEMPMGQRSDQGTEVRESEWERKNEGEREDANASERDEEEDEGERRVRGQINRLFDLRGFRVPSSGLTSGITQSEL